MEPGPGVAPVEARDEKPVEEPLEEVEPDLKKIEPDDTAANDHKAVLQHPASEGTFYILGFFLISFK